MGNAHVEGGWQEHEMMAWHTFGEATTAVRLVRNGFE